MFEPVQDEECPQELREDAGPESMLERARQQQIELLERIIRNMDERFKAVRRLFARRNETIQELRSQLTRQLAPAQEGAAEEASPAMQAARDSLRMEVEQLRTSVEDLEYRSKSLAIKVDTQRSQIYTLQKVERKYESLVSLIRQVNCPPETTSPELQEKLQQADAAAVMSEAVMSRCKRDARGQAELCWRRAGMPRPSEQLVTAVTTQLEDWIKDNVRQYRTVQYYHRLLTLIGEMFGEEACRDHTGTVQSNVLVANVPPLVEQLLRRVKALESVV